MINRLFPPGGDDGVLPQGYRFLRLRTVHLPAQEGIPRPIRRTRQQPAQSIVRLKRIALARRGLGDGAAVRIALPLYRGPARSHQAVGLASVQVKGYRVRGRNGFRLGLGRSRAILVRERSLFRRGRRSFGRFSLRGWLNRRGRITRRVGVCRAVRHGPHRRLRHDSKHQRRQCKRRPSIELFFHRHIVSPPFSRDAFPSRTQYTA